MDRISPGATYTLPIPMPKSNAASAAKSSAAIFVWYFIVLYNNLDIESLPSGAWLL